MGVEVSSRDGHVIYPELHDSLVVGVLSSQSEIRVRIQLEDGLAGNLVLQAPVFLSVSEFMHTYFTVDGASVGNIVLDATATILGESDLARMGTNLRLSETSLSRLVDLQKTHPDHTLLCLWPTHGCVLVAVCRVLSWTGSTGP